MKVLFFTSQNRTTANLFLSSPEKFLKRVNACMFGREPKTSVYRLIKADEVVLEKVIEWTPEDEKIVLPSPPRQLPSPPSTSSSSTPSPPSSTASSSSTLPSSSFSSSSDSSDSNNQKPEVQLKTKTLAATETFCGQVFYNIIERLNHAVLRHELVVQKCEYCGFPSDLEKHVREEHPEHITQ